MSSFISLSFIELNKGSLLEQSNPVVTHVIKLFCTSAAYAVG